MSGRVLTLAWLAACGGQAGHQEAAQDSATDVAGVEDSCGMVEVTTHSDPFDLIREFVERDGRGEFVGRSAWLDTASACPRWSLGHDEFTVVAGYSVTVVSQDAERARAAVVYTPVGTARQVDDAWALERLVHPIRDTMVAVRTPFGWRIERPPRGERVLTASALRSFRWRDTDRRFLEGIAARRAR